MRRIEFAAPREYLLKKRSLSTAWIEAIVVGFQHSALSLPLDVFLNGVQRRTAYGYNELRWTPQVTVPKPILEPGEFLKHPASRDAFQTVDELGNLMIRFHPHDDMNVINLILGCKPMNACFFAQLFQHLGQPVANLPSDDGTAILHAPNDVELQLMHRMAAGFKITFHAQQHTTTNSKTKRFCTIHDTF
jgi:hypothetical protein